MYGVNKSVFATYFLRVLSQSSCFPALTQAPCPLIILVAKGLWSQEETVPGGLTRPLSHIQSSPWVTQALPFKRLQSDFKELWLKLQTQVCVAS